MVNFRGPVRDVELCFKDLLCQGMLIGEARIFSVDLGVCTPCILFSTVKEIGCTHPHALKVTMFRLQCISPENFRAKELAKHFLRL